MDILIIKEVLMKNVLFSVLYFSFCVSLFAMNDSYGDGINKIELQRSISEVNRLISDELKTLLDSDVSVTTEVFAQKSQYISGLIVDTLWTIHNLGKISDPISVYTFLKKQMSLLAPFKTVTAFACFLGDSRLVERAYEEEKTDEMTLTAIIEKFAFFSRERNGLTHLVKNYIEQERQTSWCRI